jgi:competence protein ComEA
MPYFTRAQQGVILLLGAALLILFVWRANFGLAPSSPPPSKALNQVFVEVQGAVAHPGVYSFPGPPTLLEVRRRAGGLAPVSESHFEEANPPSPGLSSGTRVEIAGDGSCRLGRMTGAKLMTLGLAIDLNLATPEDLEALPGIGPALAQRIIAYRQAHGPFQKVDDLLAVSGIGPQKLEKMKLYLSLGNPEAAAPPDHGPGLAPEIPTSGASAAGSGERPRRPGNRGDAKKPPAHPIDPNLATQADLEALPGIGPVMAKRIIDYRNAHGPFKKIDDLLQVSGIGPKKLVKLKPYLLLNEKTND